MGAMACVAASCRGPMAAGELLRYQRRDTDEELRQTIARLHMSGHDRESVCAILGTTRFEYNRLTGR